MTNNNPEKRYLDDIKPGDRFTSREYLVTTENIKAFATDFDPQPFHLDEAAADLSFFEGLAASGWHTAAMTMRLMVESVPVACGLIGAGVEISWPRPTRPGDTLHVESTITAIHPSKSKPDRGIVLLQSDTYNQHGEPVQKLVSRLLVLRSPA